MAQSKRVDTLPRKTEDKPGWFARLRRKHPWLDHLVRANEAYGQRYGAHYAAAITYFSVLSLAPILLLAFSVLGFALAGKPELITQVKDQITGVVPPEILSKDAVEKLIAYSVSKRGITALIGLVTALYTGVGWMGNLRNALTAQWGVEKPELSFLPTLVKDLVALIGLGVALVVSFGVSAVVTGFAAQILEFVGVKQTEWASFLLQGIGILLSIVANFFVFLWVIAKLPRQRVTVRTAVRGAIVMAIGFEILKQAMTFYVKVLGSSPAFVVVGPVLGLLLFANFVSQLLLFTTAWIATARENQDVPVPAPGAVVRPVIGMNAGPSTGQAAGLLGVGALLGMAFFPRRKR